MRNLIVFLTLILMAAGVGLSPADADADKINLDGLWFTCEYAHSKIPPPDDCKTLDDDGFLIENDQVWHMKVQDGDKDGCRGDRSGNCFDRQRKSLIAKKRQIGSAERTPKGAIIEYMWCGQPYEIKHGEHFSEVRPVEPMCPWTSKKTYYVAKWSGQFKVVAD